MYEIRNKRSKRICKWIASLLTIVLLINESGIPVLAAELQEAGGCSCDVRCNADSINDACPVCAENYENCNAAEQEETPIQAETQIQTETQEQQEGDVPDTAAQEPVVTEPEVPVSQESGVEYENTDPGMDVSLPELNDESYVYETALGTEPGTEAGTGTQPESGSQTEESSEAAVTQPESLAVGELAVATQEELAAALISGVSKITLTADISLTTTLVVPATTNIILDGQGFSLRRGADGNGAFIGTMIYLNGVENAEETSGSLTLTNICVDGQIAGTANRAGSSAIIDLGSLILDEGAVVKGNYNYGTYISQENGEITPVINDYGGGIQVYGELTVTERALVTGNFADEFGGGVYLAEGATLYLHADVIRENAVAEGTGYGADLYAANGSTIYYNTAIDMTQAGFYLCNDVNLIGMDMLSAYADTHDDKNVEIYINVAENSGYTKEQIAELTSKLEGKGYRVLTNRTDIDTTDLRNWYVYDHYDPNAWAALGTTWDEEYGGDVRRGKYDYVETYYCKQTNPVYTIADWLKRQDDYQRQGSGGLSCATLAQFKEHIYTRNESGYPAMTFVGYGSPAFVDFLFYDPESDGEKVVNFDVDSTQVYTHTLAGSGFLVNTGVEDGKLQGYLIYYVYGDSSRKWSWDDAAVPAKATSLLIYKVDGIDAKGLHGGRCDLKPEDTRTQLFDKPIARVDDFAWDNHMSIQIKATPDKIEVRQQPTSETVDIDKIPVILSCSLQGGSKYSGFGPLVAYTKDYNSHSCDMASSFTYSNLHMYFTNPELEPGDLLNPLEKADFTQQDTQKYFLNLLGNSASDYNESANFGQYQEYMQMMQGEGIALITDKKTPFEAYLGDNLCEISKEGGTSLSIDALVGRISEYIDPKKTTYMEDKLQQEEGGEGLTKAKPNQSIGNIWLKSVSSGRQIKALNGDSLAESGFEIQPMDDISNYFGTPEKITYDIIKPNGAVVTLSSPEGALTPPSFVVAKNRKVWPAGQYAVRQTIEGSSVHGYAYFDLRWNDVEIIEDHAVTINVHKDDAEWNDSGKRFALSEGGVEPFLTEFTHIQNGTYNIYEIMQNADGTVAYADTNATVTLNGVDVAVTVDYYTITFHDGDTILDTYGKIVTKGTKVTAVSDPPVKDGYAFHGWSTSADGSTEFDFETPITAKTDFYAKWLATEHAVTINVHKDDAEWNDSRKQFALLLDGEEPFFTDLAHISDGTYNIYEITQAARTGETADTTETGETADTTDTTETGETTAVYTDTGVIVTVNGADTAATVDYYTVTCYNDGAVFNSQIVLKNKIVAEPSIVPTKEGHNFYRWGVSANADDDTEFNFGTPITAKTDLYAKWLKIEEKTFTISVSAGKGGSVSPSGEVIVKAGADQQFVITSNDGYQIDTVLVDNNAVTLENAQFFYRTLSGSVGAEINAAEPETAASESGTAIVSPLNGNNGNDAKKQYIFKNVSENHTLSATFKAVPKKKGSKKSTSSESSPDAPVSNPVQTDTRVISEPVPVPVPDTPAPAPKDSEPKTGDASHVEVYATIGMIAGLSYLLLYFADGESGMTEEEKKEIVGALVKWARKGKRFRKYVALAIVFVILVYYHSIGKRTTMEWKELYEK